MRCYHPNPYTYWMLGFWRTRCLACGLESKSIGGPQNSFVNFYQQIETDQLLERMNMTSEYRRGVEDAMSPLYTGYDSYVTVTIGTVNRDLEERRKKLLTKKVTKWVNIYRGEVGGNLSSGGSVGDTKEAAAALAMGIPYATVPFEIEVPID